MSQSIIRTLSDERAAHLANISRLEQLMPTLSPDAAARAQLTLMNLRTQVKEVDAQIFRTERRAAR